MTRNVIVVVGSPRRDGNCAVLAERAAAGIRSCGAAAEIVALQELSMEPCRACDACRQSTDVDCIIDDDLTGLLPRLRRADALLVVSPVYWFTFSAQTKLFLDRAFYAMQSPEGNALKGKPLGLIMTYAEPDPFASGAVNAFRSFQDICRFIRAPLAGIVYGSASAVGEVRAHEGLLMDAYRLGERLGGS